MKYLSIILICISLLIGGFAPPGQAAPIVIDFNDAITGAWYNTEVPETHPDYLAPYEEDGFTASGSFEIFDDYHTDNYAYLRYAYFDYMQITSSDGGLFDFLSVEYLATANNSVGYIESSNGGYYAFDLPKYELPALLSFSGHEWSSVEWIRFERTGGSFHDLDNIKVEAVPEPATMILLGSSLLFLYGCGRKKWRRKQDL